MPKNFVLLLIFLLKHFINKPRQWDIFFFHLPTDIVIRKIRFQNDFA